jgi:hypothetical protein
MRSNRSELAVVGLLIVLANCTGIGHYHRRISAN